MPNVKHIRDLVSEGELKNALHELKSVLALGKSPLTDEVIALTSQFNRWNRSKNQGLQPKEKKLRRIELAILEICNSLETPAQNISSQEVIRSSYLIEFEQIDTIVDIHQASIKKHLIFGLVLLSMAVVLFIFTFISTVIQEFQLKLISATASTVITCASAIPLKELSSRQASIRTFKNLKMLFKRLLESGEDADSEEVQERINNICALVWEATKKTALIS